MTVNVLGTEYTIIKHNYEEDPEFKERSIDGYCDTFTKEIILCDLATCPSWEDEPENRRKIAENATLRHEIVHAFYNESGLQDSAFTVECAWARNEEMVDWIAIQGPKIYKAWESVDAL